MNPSTREGSIAVTITLHIKGENGGKHVYRSGERLLKGIEKINTEPNRDRGVSLLNNYANIQCNGSRLRLVYRADGRATFSFFSTREREAEAEKKNNGVNSFFPF